MRELGVDFITVLGMPPVDFIRLTAELGCRSISIAPQPITPNPYGFPAWSLLQDAALRRATAAALREQGVRLAVGEGFFIMPGRSMRDMTAALDLMSELGAAAVNAVVMENDGARAADEFGALVELAAARGMKTYLEFVPVLAVGTLPQALELVRRAGKPDARIVIDAMHLIRGGSTPQDLARLDPKLIGHVQICDAPAAYTQQGYAHEATCERRVPGAGDLPLVDIIRALPQDMPLGIEAPQASVAARGVDVRTHLRRCVDATRVLAEAAGAP